MEMLTSFSSRTWHLPTLPKVVPNSPPLRRGSTDSSKQRLQGFCSTARAFLPPTERSDRGNTSVGHRTRVLQPLLLCSKEGRRPEAHPGSAASEFFPLQREVQDADDKNHHVSDSRRGLVCHYRPKGCVFPHPGRSATQKVPSVCLRREGLPIQGPSLQPGHGCCTGPFEAPGYWSARAPATRKLYSSKWGVFESWCLARAIDPVNCPVGPVLEFFAREADSRGCYHP